MNILGTDPLGILNAMRRAPVPFRDIELPGDDYVRRQLEEAWNILGGPEYFFGDFGQGPNDPRYGVGAAPMLPFGASLLGGIGRMGPARSLAEQARVVEQRRAFRKGERFIGSLPEVDPKQNAFRQYILDRVNVPKPTRAPRHDEQELGLLEDMEELLPERGGIANAMMQNMTQDRFGRVLEETLEQASRSRAGMANYESVDRAKINIGELINEDTSSALQVSQGLLNAGDTEAALLAVRDAARLAAINWRYNRTPKQLFEMRHDRSFAGNRALVNKQTDRVAYPGEGKSWAEMKDNALKTSFRQIMSSYRQLRQRPDRMH